MWRNWTVKEVHERRKEFLNYCSRSKNEELKYLESSFQMPSVSCGHNII
jgi:hypothetical protein